jgi:hypothetical protein
VSSLPQYVLQNSVKYFADLLNPHRFDASGNIAEHYSDGDQVNFHTPLSREPAAPNTLFIWGPNIPLEFVTGKIEDAGKPMPPPPGVVIEKAPDVVAGVPARIRTVIVS